MSGNRALLAIQLIRLNRSVIGNFFSRQIFGLDERRRQRVGGIDSSVNQNARSTYYNFSRSVTCAPEVNQASMTPLLSRSLIWALLCLDYTP